MRSALTIAMVALAAVGVFLWARSATVHVDSQIEQGAVVQQTEHDLAPEANELGDAVPIGRVSDSSTRAPVESESAATTPDLGVIDVTVQVRAGHRSELHEGLQIEIVEREFDGTFAVLGGARCDAEWTCRLALPSADGDRDLFARLAEPGWTAERARLGKGDGTSYSAILKANRGQTFGGRLVDETGEGVPGRVQMTRRFPMKNGPRLGGGIVSHAEPDGHFELHAYTYLFEPEDPGNLPVLLGFSPGHGTGCLVDFRIPSNGTPVELRVGGSGRLVGRVTDGAEHPVQALKVIARAARLGDERSTLSPLAPYREGLGYLVAATVTDERGRFGFEGLRAEAYWLFAEDSSSSVFQRTYVDLHRDPLPADGAHLDLVLKRPSFVLCVLASDGTTWQDDMEFVAALAMRHGPGPRWPVTPIIAVEDQISGHRLQGRALADGRIVYAIGDTAELRCTVFGGPLGGEGFPLQVHSLQVAEASDAGGQVQLVVQAEPLTSWGTLDLTGSVVRRDSDFSRSMESALASEPSSAGSVFGAPIPRARVLASGPLEWLPGHEFFVEDLGSDGTVVMQTNSFTPIGAAMCLPDGRYRVVIRPSPSYDAMFLADAGGAEAVVEIRAGQKSTVRLDIDAGSTLRIYVKAESGEAATLWLVSPTDRRHDLTRTASGRSTWTWPARVPLESHIVPSGPHTLHAKVGDREIVIPIDLKPAECLDVLVQ